MQQLSDILYGCSVNANTGMKNKTIDIAKDRWQRIFDTKDSKELWKAINWGGEYLEEPTDTPSDDELKNHLEQLLNSTDTEELDMLEFTTDATTIPLLESH